MTRYICKQNKHPRVNKKIQITTVYLGLTIQQEPSNIQRENTLAVVDGLPQGKLREQRLSTFTLCARMENGISCLAPLNFKIAVGRKVSSGFSCGFYWLMMEWLII